MVSSPISDMLQSPYHPDHIFGDEVTWYDAPDGLPEQEIKEYFDALEQQDVDDSVFRSKYVRDPEQNHYPTIPATNLHRKIFAFLETEKFPSSSIDYLHLTSITNKLAGLQRNHERFIAMQKFKIQKHVGELSAARKGLYDVDNVYTGSDCKRMRDLVMEKINACTCDRERVENEYLDTVSVLAKQVAEFQSKWVHERKELEARSAVQRQREKNLDIQDRLAAAMRKEKRLERKISALKAHNESLEETVEELKEQWDMQWERVWKMQRELRAHRDTIIIERRHRDEARQAQETLSNELAEEKSRVLELEATVDQQSLAIEELKTRGMRGEVYNRHNDTWEVGGAAHKRRFDEYQEVDRILEERANKRERVH